MLILNTMENQYEKGSLLNPTEKLSLPMHTMHIDCLRSFLKNRIINKDNWKNMLRTVLLEQLEENV